MIVCSSHRGRDIRNALAYIPYGVKRELNQQDKPIIFYTTHNRFGYSSAPTSVPYVIIVNDIIFPNGCGREDKMYRFFVFTVLHEVAHIYMDLNGTPIESQQESEADKLALDWYNAHADRQGLKSLSYEGEIKVTQREFERAMKSVTETIASSLNNGAESCVAESSVQHAPATATEA